MARPPKAYTRLTRNAGGVGVYTSLWLGSDHLMIVTSTGYTDNYARLQFSDIKAIFLTPTNRRSWWALWWGVPACIGGVALLVALVSGETPVFSAIFFAIGAIGLGWNYYLGAGCRAYVVTGVQTAKLSPLVRLKKTHRVLARLQPLIAAAQAHLVRPPAEPASASPAMPAGEPPVVALPPIPEAPAAPEPPASGP